MPNYRNCAGIVVFNDEGKVLMCARADMGGLNWQFPQGGINFKESITEAALRELTEETSIKSATVLLACEDPIYYVYPRRIHKALSKVGRGYVGQKMFWVLTHFYGDDSEINFDMPNPEFKAYEWVDITRAYKRIVSFKRSPYRFACKLFEPYIEAYLNRDKCLVFNEEDVDFNTADEEQNTRQNEA